MSDNINNMDFKQLRNEVQSLRDELAIMKRKYEDIIYNLDDDNFSSRFVKEKGDMRTAIEINAEGIKTKVSNEEFESTKTQTAQKIESEVKKLTDADTELSTKITQTADTIRSEVKSATATLDGKFDNYSTIEQTNNKISASVKETKEYAEGYVTDQLANGGYVTNATFKSQFDIHADGIYSEVSETYETKSDANSSYSSLSSSITSVRQTANSISTRVGKVENGQFGDYTLFEQSDDTFLFDGDYMRINSAIQLADESGNHIFSIFHNTGNGVSAGRRGTYMCGVSLNLATPDPLMIGASNQSVYLYDAVESNLIATQGWVLANAGGSGGTATAVFG